MSEVKKNASGSKSKAMSEKEEVLENIMEELEQEAKDKEEEKAAESKEEAAKDTEKEAEGSAKEAKKETEEKSEPEAGDAPEEKKKGLFSKKEKKNPLQEKVDELNDRVLRQMAEFENFRKRTEKEKSVMFEMGAKSVIEKILPVVDNFERGLATASDEDKQDPIYEGMSLIYKQLSDELDKMGVKPIEALGVEFNPEFHNAVMQEESDEFEEGIICKELQKGYTYKDSVVRHSMVAVAK